MNLAGRNILVDTYNLRLKQGSGIKTYGYTLIDALRRLEANVSLLGDKPVGRSRSRVLDEVLFHDVRKPEGGRRGLAGRLVRAAKNTFTARAPAPIGRDHVVPDASMRRLGGVKELYNVSRVYDLANDTYKRFGTWTRLKRSEGIDVWHATTLLPIQMRGVRMVTTIHDLIPLRLPYTTLDDKKFFFTIVRDTLKRADLIFSVSQCTKQDILRFFDVPEERIVVTYQGVPFGPHRPNPALEDAVLKRHNLASKGFLLFVGNIEPKKNLVNLLRAVEGVTESLPLVIVGRKAWLWEDQLEPLNGYSGVEMKRRFRMLDYVSPSDLHALYAHAAALVFPSVYEGFGLPPLEAMAHGCPVICSNVSSLPEVCADAAAYVDPYDPSDIRRRVDEVLSDDSRRRAMVEAGYRRLEEFSAERYAARLGDAYARVLH